MIKRDGMLIYAVMIIDNARPARHGRYGVSY